MARHVQDYSELLASTRASGSCIWSHLREQTLDFTPAHYFFYMVQTGLSRFPHDQQTMLKSLRLGDKVVSELHLNSWRFACGP